MSIETYITCASVALIGMILQALLKIKSLQDKSRKANVKFSVGEYLTDDWVSHCASVVTIALFLFFITDILNFNESAAKYLKIGFAFVGYTGSDIASRIFSVVNKRINNAIDYKTTIADQATGNTENPTPTK